MDRVFNAIQHLRVVISDPPPSPASTIGRGTVLKNVIKRTQRGGMACAQPTLPNSPLPAAFLDHLELFFFFLKKNTFKKKFFLRQRIGDLKQKLVKEMSPSIFFKKSFLCLLFVKEEEEKGK
jgi:hypothetical protein